MIFFPHGLAYFIPHKFYAILLPIVCISSFYNCVGLTGRVMACATCWSLVAIFLLSVQGLLQTSPLCCGKHRHGFYVDKTALGILLLLVLSLVISRCHSCLILFNYFFWLFHVHICIPSSFIVILLWIFSCCLLTHILWCVGLSLSNARSVCCWRTFWSFVKPFYW